MHTIESMPILILNAHSRCNCRCLMCDIWKVETIQEISAADIERHAADIKALGVRWVVFSGGEPLMHSDLFRLSRQIRGLGIRTTLLTAGLLLPRHAAAAARSLDELIVSLDGPPAVHDRIRGVPQAFKLLGSGIEALRAQNPGFPITARCTVQRANHYLLRETVRTASELALGSISFLAADVRTTAFNRHGGWAPGRRQEVALSPAETDRLEAEIEMLIGELPEHRGFVVETPEKLRRIARHFRAELGLADLPAPRCNAPWVSAVIEADGNVRPCFFHEPVGNIRRQRLSEAVNGKAGVDFRSALDVASNPVCRNCVCSLFLAPNDFRLR